MPHNVGRVVFILAKLNERLIARTTDTRRTFFERSEFPWIAALERESSLVRAELDGLLARVDRIPSFQEVSEDQAYLTQDDRWKTFVFRAYGRDVAGNARRCPETIRLLRTIPGVTTAMFSILRGPKHIAPHHGPYNGVLRLHLALKVPAGSEQSWIRVGAEKRSWEEGRALIFDDTHEHEVHHPIVGDRVVLFVDFLRPLPVPLALLNRATIALIAFTQPFVTRAMRNLARWEALYGGDFDRPEA